jgi:trehalose/maltose hydrolase-like predicted phosphorylase
VADEWVLRFDGFAAEDEGRRETLCALGNGYVVVRGAAPEHRADGVHYPGTYVGGVYNRLTDHVDGRAVENESLVNLPSWLYLTFAAEDGPWLGEDGARGADVEVSDQWVELDMRRGVLTRNARVRDATGRVTRLGQRRFVHMEQPHLAGLETTLQAENWSGTLRVRSGVDGGVVNAGVPRYRDLDGRHLSVLGADAVTEDTVLVLAETNQSRVRVAVAARTDVQPPEGTSARREVVTNGSSVFHELAVPVREGQAVTVSKIAAVHTSRDRAISEPVEACRSEVGRAPGFDELLERHVLAWDHLWERFNLQLEGDGDALRIVRLHLFHLMQTLSEHTVDLDVGVPPRGLHGEAYRGHVFWDELFVLPTLSLRMPSVVQALLGYRYRRLPEARRAAAAEGQVGALFPWQSGSDGREESQRVHLNPVSGRWLPDTTYKQRHVGLAIAYNVWEYYQATDNLEFLVDYGAEIILDVARYFAGLATYDDSRGRYVIRGVVGPDEFHTDYPGRQGDGIDNNAYTNVMVAWLLLRAETVLDRLPAWRRRELEQRLGITAADRARWLEVRARLFVPFHGDGIISQFEGYEDLAELDWAAYRDRYGDIQRLDRILEAEGDSANNYKVSKQADVLMLLYLMSGDELRDVLEGLGYALGPEQVGRTIDYYEARTSHGSTLSAVVHAWALARAHRGEALEHFLRALESDASDIQHGTTAEGIHLAAMAGSIDVLQRCFAGLEVREDALRLSPYWPRALGTLEMTLRYREHDLCIRVSADSVRVSSAPGAGQPIRLVVGEEATTMSHGDVAEVALAPHDSAAGVPRGGP